MLFRSRLLPWIRAYSPFEHAGAGDPPIYLSYPAAPALGQDQKDPTHTANFGVKLQERLREVGVPCELVYPGAPDVRHPGIDDYLIADQSFLEPEGGGAFLDLGTDAQGGGRVERAVLRQFVRIEPCEHGVGRHRVSFFNQQLGQTAGHLGGHDDVVRGDDAREDDRSGSRSLIPIQTSARDDGQQDQGANDAPCHE